jgi:hypothetical protein
VGSIRSLAFSPDGKTLVSAGHNAVRASLRNVDLTKATTALTLVLRNEGEKMGELVVGRGSFFWKARNGKKRKRITWSDFAAMMDRHPG